MRLSCRGIDCIAQLKTHILSLDYSDTPSGRAAHAARAAKLGHAVLEARACAVRAGIEHLSTSDAVVEHVVPRNIHQHGHPFVLGREDGQEKKNQEAKAMARACISRIITYVKYARKSGTSVILEKTMALQLAERLSLREDATSNAATYVMSYLKNYQGKTLARLEADGVQVKRERKCLRRSIATAAWRLRPRTRKSLQACALPLGRSRLPPPRVLTHLCVPAAAHAGDEV
jgi:hypothetical protein